MNQTHCSLSPTIKITQIWLIFWRQTSQPFRFFYKCICFDLIVNLDLEHINASCWVLLICLVFCHCIYCVVWPFFGRKYGWKLLEHSCKMLVSRGNIVMELGLKNTCVCRLHSNTKTVLLLLNILALKVEF